MWRMYVVYAKSQVEDKTDTAIPQNEIICVSFTVYSLFGIDMYVAAGPTMFKFCFYPTKHTQPGLNKFSKQISN